MITITSQNNKTNVREKLDINGKTRPYVFNKSYIFMSARVHPGEVPSSHTLNGVIKFLFDEHNF